MIIPPKTRKKLVISLVPLIDILFILLVFFMLTTHYKLWSFLNLGKVYDDLPVSLSTNKPFMIALYADHIRIDGIQYKNYAKNKRFKNKIQATIEHSILVRPHRSTNIQQLVSLLEYLNNNSQSNITLVK